MNEPARPGDPDDDLAARRAAAERVADLLEEHGRARAQLVDLIETLGLDFLADALAKTTNGLARASRRLTLRSDGQPRTNGGVFFQAARKLISGRWRKRIAAEERRRLLKHRAA